MINGFSVNLTQLKNFKDVMMRKFSKDLSLGGDLFCKIHRKITFVSTKNKTLKKGCKLDAHSPFDLI